MISFIVPAHDEERLLGRTLVAIHDAAAGIGQPYEVIVVDDASVDLTSAIAAQHGARIERVEYRQISRTRNAGARLASGDPLIFVDADTVISSRVLRGTMEALQRGAVGGGALITADGSKRAHRAVDATGQNARRRREQFFGLQISGPLLTGHPATITRGLANW